MFFSETALPNEPKFGGKKNCLWRPCALMDRDKMSNLYRGPSIDAFYQVSVHLAKRFQRRRILKISQSDTRVACGLGKKQLWKVLYRDCSFRFDPLTNMANTGNYFFRLVDF
jgi:hypothetical protein